MLPPPPLPLETPPTVLCVDPNPRMLELLVRVLAPLPLTCLSSSQAEAACQHARQHRVQLVILGWPLPEGWELLQALRAETQPAPRVMLIAADLARFDYALAANVAGADACLGKPFEAEVLRREVARLLNLPATGKLNHD